MVPIRLLFLAFQFSICLLQLISKEFQIPRQFIVSFKFLRHQHQISSSIVQWNITYVQSTSAMSKNTKLKSVTKPSKFHCNGIPKETGIRAAKFRKKCTFFKTDGKFTSSNRPNLQHWGSIRIKSNLLLVNTAFDPAKRKYV